jgi:hypothetical protein
MNDFWPSSRAAAITDDLRRPDFMTTSAPTRSHI